MDKDHEDTGSDFPAEQTTQHLQTTNSIVFCAVVVVVSGLCCNTAAAVVCTDSSKLNNTGTKYFVQNTPQSLTYSTASLSLVRTRTLSCYFCGKGWCMVQLFFVVWCEFMRDGETQKESQSQLTAGL